jgi:hypothetical protein
MKRLLLVALMWGVSFSAFAVYRCDIGGNVTYSDNPCPGGRQLDIKPAQAPDAGATKRLAQEKKELKLLETARHKREAQEEKAMQRAARQQAATKSHCDKLAMRKKWADEDAKQGSRRHIDNAKLKSRRLSEQHALECGKPL